MPSLDFDEEHSDVELPDEEDALQAPAPPVGKRKARQDSAAQDAKPAKKAKKSGAAELVGRVLAVPAWKFEMAWAGENFKRLMSAVLIGDVTAVDPKRPLDSFACIMREGADYDLRLTRA